jgi:peptidoglycan L-alanyl-D-glutamate endopeptidase CwlK
MRGTDKLHPVVMVLAERFKVLCKEANLDVVITDTRRTEAEQNGISATNTNAKYPNSYHNWGLAFDFCKNAKGDAAYNDMAFFKRAAEIGKSLGLFWGGDFKNFKGDYGHLEDQSHGNIKSLVDRWKTPENFMACW